MTTTDVCRTHITISLAKCLTSLYFLVSKDSATLHASYTTNCSFCKLQRRVDGARQTGRNRLLNCQNDDEDEAKCSTCSAADKSPAFTHASVSVFMVTVSGSRLLRLMMSNTCQHRAKSLLLLPRNAFSKMLYVFTFGDNSYDSNERVDVLKATLGVVSLKAPSLKDILSTSLRALD